MPETSNTVLVRAEQSVFIKNDKLFVKAGFRKSSYPVSNIIKIAIRTFDTGPFLDDMCLAIMFEDGLILIIFSEHKCFATLLFDEIGKLFPIDYKKVIEAQTCAENANFMLYERSDD